MTATTFDGLAFGIEPEGNGLVPLPSRKLIWSSEHIASSGSNPGGNVNESAGLGPLTFSATLHVAIAAEASWRARLGQTKVLIIDGVSYGSLRMTAMDNIRKTIRPIAGQLLVFSVEMSS
jgi:hypothetical protein